jgi:AGCS family alanine or glycine:cation symporter
MSMIRMICLFAGLLCANAAVAQDAPAVGQTQAEVGATNAVPAQVVPAPPAAAPPPPAAAVEAPAVETADEQSGIETRIDAIFGDYLVGPIATVFFWNIPVLDMPLVVFWLLMGATFFTVRMGFVNVRMFRHAIDLVAGKYDDETSEGEVTHFQALSAALSATVGLGNIAGVAIAVALGGPGATFWMILVGLIGMSAKFTECTLG